MHVSQKNKIDGSEAELTAILNQLSTTTDLNEAKEVARQFLNKCAMQKSMPTKLRQLEQMTSLQKIVGLCYNTMLSGEGLAVQK